MEPRKTSNASHSPKREPAVYVNNWSHTGLFLFFLQYCSCSNTGKPFGTGAAKSTHVKETPGFLQRTLFELRRVQRQLQKDLADAVNEFKKTSSSKAAFILIGLAFFYGVFHAVGPGHGKIVISSYLVAHESVIRRGILLAFLSSFGQGISAIVLVGIFISILDFSRLATTNFVWTLEQVSYGLMICIGLWMLI